MTNSWIYLWLIFKVNFPLNNANTIISNLDIREYLISIKEISHLSQFYIICLLLIYVYIYYDYIEYGYIDYDCI